VRSDGARFAWLVSQAAEPVTVKPQLAAGLRLCALGGPATGDTNGTVTLGPFGVSVFALTATGGQAPASRG